MPDCEYCGASFAEEDAHLEHLGEDHWEELGRIDRRQVEDHRGGGGGISRVALALGALALFLVGLLVFVTVFQGGGETRTEATDLPDAGAASVIENVTREPGQSRTHVSAGTDVDYQHMPPSGGPHYDDWVTGGFYEPGERPRLGELVHSLEHGAVVVWYDPDELTPEAEESLRAWGRSHQDDFGSVIAVPTPVEDPEAAYVLTAWERRLTMDEYEVETVRAIAAEYLGRGPEQAIR
jgi:hypothetical protein